MAIEIPGETRRRLFDLAVRAASLSGGIRASREGNIHLTLKFLGQVEADRISRIELGLRKAAEGMEPFEMSFTGAGFFPQKGAPRILWAGARGGWKIFSLKDRIEESLLKAGFEKEAGEYSPHITIARITGKLGRDARESLSWELSRHKGAVFGRMTVSSVFLVESRLRKEGACYSKLSEFPLSGTGR